MPRKPAVKAKAETTVTAPEEVPFDVDTIVNMPIEEEKPLEREYSGARIVCVGLDKSAQIHVLLPEVQQNRESGQIAIESKILRMNESVAAEDVPESLLESVKSESEDLLRYVADADELLAVQNETRARSLDPEAQLVGTTSTVYQSHKA